MELLWRASGRILAGLFFTATFAMPQAYTISAKSGAVNYIEGSAYLNGKRLSDKATRATFMSANDTLSTDHGRAEVLLSPGVFLRIGNNGEIRMISPSLVNTQVAVTRGEAMIEVAGLVKDNTVQVTDHGASVTIDKDGLYRIRVDQEPTIAVLEGKAQVNVGDREISLGKGHEILISDALKTQKFDKKEDDDLYAWSNVRSEYDAAASYQTAQSVSSNSFGGWGGYGFAGFASPGWYWANGFNSYAWLPGSGAFYSPFGYGFYAPGAVGYAPVVFAPVYGGRLVSGGSGVGVTRAAVPVNPNNPAAVGAISASPFANQVARAQAAQSFAASGFHTASGVPVAAFSGGRMTGFSNGGRVGVASAGVSAAGRGSGVAMGGFSGGGRAGGGHR